MKPKTAVIYARVSDKKQVENDISIPGQIEKGTEKALSLGADAPRVFVDEGVSAWSSTREGFESAVEYCEAFEVDYFICWSSSRFARNRFDAAINKRRLDKSGTKLIYLTFTVDRDTDAGRLLDGFLEIMDEHKSVQTSRDTTRSLIRNAESGYWNGGRPTFGFKVVPSEDNPRRKRLKPNDDETELLIKIFELRVQGHGIRTIALWLNEQGHTNRGNLWNKSVIGTLLHNQACIGKTVFGKTSRRTGRAKPQDEWIIVDSHEPVIPIDLWDRVQDLIHLDSLNSMTSSPHSTRYFTGILKCGECGAAMHTESAKGRSRRYWYYNCSEAKLNKKHVSRRLPAADIDNWLIEVICDNLFTKEVLTETLHSLYEITTNWKRDNSERRKSIIQKITGIQRRQNNLYETLELYGKGAPNLGDLTKRLRKNNDDIKILEQQLSLIDTEKTPIIDIEDEDITDLSEFLLKTIKNTESPKAVRLFFNTFIKEVVIDDDSARIAYNPEKLVNRPDWAVPSKVIWLPDLDSNQGQTD